MPLSIMKFNLLCDTILQRQGLPYKGCRSWRRLLVNAPLAQLIASGQFAALPGMVAVLTRLGSWAHPSMDKSTMWEVYTSSVTDMQAMDVTRVCSDRAPASDHRLAVRQAALQRMVTERPASTPVDPGESGGYL